MAEIEKDTRVKTFIQVTYSIPVSPDNLMRRELHRVKDEVTTDFVVVQDNERDVGEKDDWKDGLQDQLDALEDQKADIVNSFNDQIELLQDQINEIDGL